MVTEYRISHQVYYDRDKDILRSSNDKNVIERVIPIAIDMFDASIDNYVTEQFVGRNGRDLGPNIDHVCRCRQDITHWLGNG